MPDEPKISNNIIDLSKHSFEDKKIALEELKGCIVKGLIHNGQIPDLMNLLLIKNIDDKKVVLDCFLGPLGYSSELVKIEIDCVRSIAIYLNRQEVCSALISYLKNNKTARKYIFSLIQERFADIQDNDDDSFESDKSILALIGFINFYTDLTKNILFPSDPPARKVKINNILLL